jgi:hypothetical protein
MCALISYHICYSVMLLICIGHWYLPLPQFWKSHFGPHPGHDKKCQNFEVLLLQSLAFFFLNLHTKGNIWRNFHASVRMWSIFPLIACTIYIFCDSKVISATPPRHHRSWDSLLNNSKPMMSMVGVFRGPVSTDIEIEARTSKQPLLCQCCVSNIIVS